MLPPGDLRMALAALCGDDDWGTHLGRVAAAPVRRHRRARRSRGRQPADRRAVGAARRPGRRRSTGSARLLGAAGRVLPMAAVPLDIVADVDGARPGRPGRGRHGPRPGRGRDDAGPGRGRSRWCPPDPPACPEAVAAVLDGGLGGARPGVVVHQRDPAPAGAGAGRGAGRSRRRAGSSRSTWRRSRGRPRDSPRSVTWKCSPRTRRSWLRCGAGRPGAVAKAPSRSWPRRPMLRATLLLADVAAGDGHAARPGAAGGGVPVGLQRHGAEDTG